MAYYYDVVRPNTAVELNQCKFNHMGMDGEATRQKCTAVLRDTPSKIRSVRYRHPPNFFSRKAHKVGRCRNNLEECEDCMQTNTSLIYNIHYTQCRKPWNCIGVGHEGGRVPGGPPGTHIDTDAGNLGEPPTKTSCSLDVLTIDLFTQNTAWSL